ncbi:MAG: hypothetical protein C6P37_10870 [Caldibacillus debilis]|jgi:hypothetical protein|uniref:Uncharacterized protein n=1 Tax=Caldibacillus debilis TaxID=301148 RepID=A0A150M491_9BACI|nr:hypothetical protein B4135_2079 [Caldibacillus debilis]REJ27603.1 MAG: hypothetical protein C6P37_10870 [Caldibacillus debilis]
MIDRKRRFRRNIFLRILPVLRQEKEGEFKGTRNLLEFPAIRALPMPFCRMFGLKRRNQRKLSIFFC